MYLDIIGDWGLGIGDWGLGIGPIPNPQSPIPNPQSPSFIMILYIFYFKHFLIYEMKLIKQYINNK